MAGQDYSLDLRFDQMAYLGDNAPQNVQKDAMKVTDYWEDLCKSPQTVLETDISVTPFSIAKNGI